MGEIVSEVKVAKIKHPGKMFISHEYESGNRFECSK